MKSRPRVSGGFRKRDPRTADGRPAEESLARTEKDLAATQQFNVGNHAWAPKQCLWSSDIMIKLRDQAAIEKETTRPPASGNQEAG